MSLLAVRDAHIQTLKDAFRDRAVQIAAHPGRFDEEDLKALAARTPAILLSCVTVRDVEWRKKQAYAPVTWVATVLTKDTSESKLDALALLIVPKVVATIGRNLPASMEETKQILEGSAPVDLAGVNLTTPKITKAYGLSVWAVSWRQKQFLGDESDPSLLADLITINSKIDLAPTEGRIEAEDEITLEQP